MPRIYRRYQAVPAALSGYTYFGPCRCGLSPNAFYVAPDGTILHAAQMFDPFPVVPPELGKAEERELLEEEARMLEEELAQIKKRLEELEKEVK